MPGFVRLDHDVAEEIVRICDVMLAELESARATTRKLVFTDGFGDFDSAQQLAAGYRRKAAGTPESAKERVEQFIDSLTRLRDAFAGGGEAFLDTELDWSRQLGTLDAEQPHPS